jgi:flagellar motor switch/type III secretory pathway protein FliN
LSACLPVKWLPDTLPGHIEVALRDVLEQWAREWGAPAASSVAARRLEAQESPSATLVAPWGDLPKTWQGSLARALLGPAAPASPVAQGATQQATTDLQATLHRRFQSQTPQPFVPARIGHGGVEARFELLGMPFGFVLDLAELQSGGWLLAAPTRRLQAVPFEQALHDVSVPLTAQLGRARVSVTDILQLQPGNILLLTETLDAPLQVRSPGSPLQLTAHLGASDAPSPSTRRAMRWLAS